MKTIRATDMEVLSRLQGDVGMLRREWREANRTAVCRFDELGRQLQRIHRRLDALEERLDESPLLRAGDEVDDQ